MLILLPPSETKRDGGDDTALDVRSLRFPELASRRRAALRAVRALARDRDACMAALRLGATLTSEVDRNRAVHRSATMPAIDRYTGVLFDALEAPTLTPEARSFARQHLVIHSALLGPVGALDPIPAYRLSFDSRLSELPLRPHWSAAVGALLARVDGVLLDLRSEGYASLGPRPTRPDSVYLRVVTRSEDGATRALNHFNKKAKGVFTRAILEHGVDFATVDDLLRWASSAGFDVRRGAPGELELVTVP